MVFNHSKLRQNPPLASSETLMEKSLEPQLSKNSTQDSMPGFGNIMSFQQFQTLDEDAKNGEILRLLPLMAPFAKDFASLRSGISSAAEKIAELENLKKLNHANNVFLTSTEDVSYTWSVPLPLVSEQRPPDPFIIQKSKLLNRRVALNVGGVRHEVMWKMLEQIPLTRLGLLAGAKTHEQITELCADYSLVDNEYFFDRHPRSFNTILNFYRTGKLHISDEMCILAFRDDLEYWMIEESYLEACCRDKFETYKESVLEEMEIEAKKMEKDDEENFGNGKLAKYQKWLWDTIEKPDTSFLAKIVSTLSITFVVVSTVGMVMSTLQSLKYQDMDGNMVDNPYLDMIESVCISWFTLEYLLRFAGAPGKWVFLKDGMNIIDVLSIMPYFVSLFVLNPPTGGEEGYSRKTPLATPSRCHQIQKGITTTTSSPKNIITTTPTSEKAEPEEGGVDDILQVFRIFKLARIFKLGRHSPGLQAIAFTLKNSYKELLLLIFLMCITGLIFSALCYFIEKDEESGFTDILTGFYWVVVTMTTVGYGDIYPQTGLGKLVGTMCAVSGVLVLSLPIPIIAGNFEKFHKEQQGRDKGARRKLRLNEAKEKELRERMAECGPAVKQAALSNRAMSIQIQDKIPMSPHSDLVTTKSLF